MDVRRIGLEIEVMDDDTENAILRILTYTGQAIQGAFAVGDVLVATESATFRVRAGE